MKTLITGTAIIVLFVIFSCYQADYNLFIRQNNHLKSVTIDAADSGSLYSEDTNGYKIYNKTEGIKAIDYIIKNNLKLDDTLTPLPTSYWTQKIDYYTYFFDGNGVLTTYKNTSLISSSNFSFSYLFTEPLTGYVKGITEPTVIVTVDAKKPRFRISFLTTYDVIRTSAYEEFSL